MSFSSICGSISPFLPFRHFFWSTASYSSSSLSSNSFFLINTLFVWLKILHSKRETFLSPQCATVTVNFFRLDLNSQRHCLLYFLSRLFSSLCLLQSPFHFAFSSLFSSLCTSSTFLVSAALSSASLLFRPKVVKFSKQEVRVHSPREILWTSVGPSSLE